MHINLRKSVVKPETETITNYIQKIVKTQQIKPIHKIRQRPEVGPWLVKICSGVPGVPGILYKVRIFSEKISIRNILFCRISFISSDDPDKTQVFEDCFFLTEMFVSLLLKSSVFKLTVLKMTMRKIVIRFWINI